MFKNLKLPKIEIDYQGIYKTVGLYAGELIIALVLLFVGFKIIKWIINRINRRLDKSRIDPSLKSFLSPLISITLKFALFLSILGIFGIQVTSFIALLGTAGFAVGLALQGSLSNFAGGVLILLLKPFKVGDYIETEGFSGTVKDIHIFYTVLTTIENKKIVIPNSGLSNSNLINYSANPTRRMELKISCSYENDVIRVRDILLNFMKSHPAILEDPAPTVFLTEYGNSSINFSCRGWAKSVDYWDTYYDLMLRVKGELDKHQITIPYPQLDVHMIENKKTHE